MHGAVPTENTLNAPRDALGAANGLLAVLPLHDHNRVLAACQRVEPRMDQVLARPGEPMAHAWFPAGAVLSLAIAVRGPASGSRWRWWAPRAWSACRCYHRGVAGLLDRRGLERAACSCDPADRASPVRR